MAPIPPSVRPIFTVPIPSVTMSTGKPSDPGLITVTIPSPDVYLVSFTSPPDNRLTPAFNGALRLALLIIRHKHPKGVVILTSGIQKFFSNGLDYESAVSNPTFFGSSLFPLWHTLLTYPMPVIALVNGHAFAGGLMTAMFCDYRIMNPHRGFVCLNELEFGASLRPGMAAIFRQKIANPAVFRQMTLESKRYNALEALEVGIVDGLGGLEETLKYIAEMKLTEKAKSPSYGTMKEISLYRETILQLENEPVVAQADKLRATHLEMRWEGEGREVDEWEKAQKAGKAKL